MPQDIRLAVRQALFQNNSEEWPYSHGGTLFVVNFEGRCYGLTCWHVLRGRDDTPLLVWPLPSPVIGTRPIPIERIAKIRDTESELQDIAVIHFPDGITPDHFHGTAYVLDFSSWGTSEAAHRLKVYGYLVQKSDIDYEARNITAGYCDLQFTELGARSCDPFLRQAVATYTNHGFTSLDGLSGAPVFDESAERLCGMIVRGGLNEHGKGTIWYIDMFDIFEVVRACHAGVPKLNYLKSPRPW